MKKIIQILFFAIPIAAVAQPQVADKIVAQVGNNIILKSDIEAMYQRDAATSKESMPDNYRCISMYELVLEKMLLLQAVKDSVDVKDDEVNYELDRRIRYFESQFGSKEKMESFYGKSEQAMKEEFRDDIKSQLLAQKMQDKILGDVTISPSEVKAFFNKIPKDSLPYFNAEVEIAQIEFIPQATQEQKEFAKEKLEDIRKRIANGEDFNLLAKIYSEDGSTKDNGGDLGCQTRGTFVPEFDAAAFKLKAGEVSEVVQTQFGYHIIKMESRQGDKACLRHILIVPPVTNSNIQIGSKKLDSLRTQIADGKISFHDAALKYSQDETTNKNGGDVLNPQTQTTSFTIEQLEPEIYYAIEKLKPGEITPVLTTTTADGKKALRIIMLKSQTAPHKANLNDDYARMQAAALNEKKYRLMNDWMQIKIKSVYLKMDNTYTGCETIQNLVTKANEVDVK